ncbi:hypothetical protein VHEMI06022 [[Torrubiella] hemipterigena]|uniref:Beta-catenin-like protein 1 N-terminal domain-containing protein n=1 Tax=[Torrubiella] hemipterigena TaxID=1531966 RepID=A0A0A1T605_9HYPO|nr:hypothetical protein VHEMI06022 [[Torrubiella] hemipterigena]
MASIDDIFKKSGLPSKRKLETLRDPNEVYKANKLSATGDSSRRARVDDEDVEPTTSGADADENGEDFGPAMPPNDEGDDDEGRFFGGGITQQESEILEFVNEVEEGKEEKIDAVWLRKTVLNFEKRITKNAELRAKFESEPQKFISSEADLDADIKNLSILAEHPELYLDFVKLGSANSLVGLLAHENTDIAIDAIELIGELTDEDVAAEDEYFDALADALLDADLIDLLTSNFSRLNEDDESDRNGVYYAMGVLENLCSRSAYATRIGQDSRLRQWLLERVQRKEANVSQNKQYAAEIIAILAQGSPENRSLLASSNAVDILLQLIAPYRKRDPSRGSDEEEYMANLFEGLTCMVDEEQGKQLFIEAEGLELCLIILKEGKMARTPALRLLDHASVGTGSIDMCLKLVDAGGLKSLFTIFMKTKDPRQLDHLLTIFSNMLRRLPADSPERIRTLVKFVEKDYEKLKRVMSLRWEYSSRVKMAEQDFLGNRHSAIDDDELQIELMSQRLTAGLFTWQVIDNILAWLAVEDMGAKKLITSLLADRDEGLDSLRATLKSQVDGLDDDQDTVELKDMLTVLIDIL